MQLKIYVLFSVLSVAFSSELFKRVPSRSSVSNDNVHSVPAADLWHGDFPAMWKHRLISLSDLVSTGFHGDSRYCENGVNIQPSSSSELLKISYNCQVLQQFNDVCHFNEIRVGKNTSETTERYIIDQKVNELILPLTESVTIKFRQSKSVQNLCYLTSPIEKLNTARYGESCQVDDQCLSDNTVCGNDSKCICKESYCYYSSRHSCIRCYELGENCTHPETEQNGLCKPSYSYCKTLNGTNSGVCSCHSSYIQIGNNCWLSMNAIEDNYRMAAQVAIAAAIVVSLAILLAIVWNAIKHRVPDVGSRLSAESRSRIDSIDRFVEERLRNRPPAYSPDSDKPPTYEESVSSDSNPSSERTSVTTLEVGNPPSTPLTPPPEYSTVPPESNPATYVRMVSYSNSAFIAEDGALTQNENSLCLNNISSSVDNTPVTTPVTEYPPYTSTYL